MTATDTFLDQLMQACAQAKGDVDVRRRIAQVLTEGKVVVIGRNDLTRVRAACTRSMHPSARKMLSVLDAALAAPGGENAP